MKKLLITILIIITGVLLNSSVLAYPIGDSDDIFYVTAPGPNQKVSGTISISWRMWDDDQASIQYTAKLYDSVSCESVNYGTINSNLSGTSNLNSDNVLAWNTNNTQSSTNLPDGNYCLQICAAMKNGAASYSACNSRIVRIVNHNSLPVITSNPSNLTIKESDSWSYQVTAYDTNNDPLTYSLIYSTNFLEVNSQTGLIKTKSVSKALPNGVNQANYKVVVSVNDGISGSVTQEFTLNVVRDNPVTPPAVTPPPSNVPPATIPPSEPNIPEESENNTNQPSKIEYIYPTDNSILKGVQNEIKWSITEPDGIKSIKLEYSENNDSGWKLIKTLITAPEVASSTFNWDVTPITDGIYFMKISVVDNEGSEVNRVSDNFLIRNKSEETQSQPLIINLKPESDSEVTTNITELSAEFVPSGTSKVVLDSIKIILNDVDISSKCTKSETGFSCTLDQPLEEGKHSINVTYQDTDKKVAGLNWTFDVNTMPEDQVLSQENILILGREIPKNSLYILVSLICVLTLLLIIPWVLYRNWKRTKDKGSATFTNSYVPGSGFNDNGTFTPLNSGYQTQEPTIQSLTQPSSQDEIEKTLNEYWKDQGQTEPYSYTEPEPIIPRAEPAKPFQDITPTAPEPIDQPSNPTQVPPSQPKVDQQRNTEAQQTPRDDEYYEVPNFMEPTPTDLNNDK